MTLASQDLRPIMAPVNASRSMEERRAVRHSKRVRRLRVILPLLSIVMALGLLGAAALPKLFPLSQLAGLSLTADGLVMNSPRLAGSLGSGRRYEVVAERAVQSLLQPSRLSLDGLNADLDLGNGQTVTIDGTHAAYDTSTEVLTLSDGVSIASSDGNRAMLKSATVFLKEGRVESAGDIEIDSPKGRIRAGGIDITGGGALIRLTGGVSIVIQPALR